MGRDHLSNNINVVARLLYKLCYYPGLILLEARQKGQTFIMKPNIAHSWQANYVILTLQ